MTDTADTAAADLLNYCADIVREHGVPLSERRRLHDLVAAVVALLDPDLDDLDNEGDPEDD